MTIRRIVPNINSNDLEQSMQFYGNFLGMQWILTFASKDYPTAQISIIKKEESIFPNNDVTLTIEVSHVDALYKTVKSLGYKVLYPISNEPWGVRRFFLKDPNRVTINIMSHL